MARVGRVFATRRVRMGPGALAPGPGVTYVVETWIFRGFADSALGTVTVRRPSL